MKIATTDTEFRALELASDKRSATVRVWKMALRSLIADHIVLLAAAKKAGVQIEAGPDQWSLS